MHLQSVSAVCDTSGAVNDVNRKQQQISLHLQLLMIIAHHWEADGEEYTAALNRDTLLHA